MFNLPLSFMTILVQPSTLTSELGIQTIYYIEAGYTPASCHRYH